MSRFSVVLQVVAVVIGGLWVFTYWEKRDDGRYVYHHVQATDQASEDETVFDTRTGTLYELDTNNGNGTKPTFVELHPQTGAAISHELKRADVPTSNPNRPTMTPFERGQALGEVLVRIMLLVLVSWFMGKWVRKLWTDGDEPTTQTPWRRLWHAIAWPTLIGGIVVAGVVAVVTLAVVLESIYVK